MTRLSPSGRLQSLLTFSVNVFPSNDSHKYVDLPDKVSLPFVCVVCLVLYIGVCACCVSVYILSHLMSILHLLYECMYICVCMRMNVLVCVVSCLWMCVLRV